ncbi:uncharacterized protein N7458_001255 [Penicillium daleae]|uniref:Uncharacterized protein n=1 Tax=Penicillium daleae TaxID=63821 RepID=A0AAD6CAT9_9EURO|nr:uncharacterized protein N7458_001255 [Penicillium daleae]KAJ5459703.1 hypothetical protein N7458_001255 [Penicillium daleae]
MYNQTLPFLRSAIANRPKAQRSSLSRTGNLNLMTPRKDANFHAGRRIVTSAPPSKTLAPDSTWAWGLGPEGVQIVLE